VVETRLQPAAFALPIATEKFNRAKLKKQKNLFFKSIYNFR